MTDDVAASRVTPDSATLLALADRCEAARGADRELDFAITETLGFVAIGYERASSHGRPMGYYWSKADFKAPFVTPERYTASLDAAMSLVPEGWRLFRLVENDAGSGYAECVRRYDTAETNAFACGPTPALALCAASLKARAASMGGGA